MNYSRFDDAPDLAEFRKEVRAFIDQNLTSEMKEELRQKRDEHHPDFFRALGKKGWLIPGAPHEIGGASLSYEQIEILDAELTAAAAPTINHSTTRMVFPSVVRFAQEPVRSEVIREVTAGETALTLGYSEPDGGSDIAAAKTRAVRQADGDWLINGSKVFTTGAHHAKYIFLLANSDPQGPKRRNLTMFLLPTRLEGVAVTPIHTLGERTNAVYFGDVRLPDIYRLGEVGDGWRVLQGPLEAEHGVGAEGGGLRTHIDISVLYGRRLALAVQAALEWLSSRPKGSPEETGLLHYRLGQLLLRVESSLAADRLEGRVQSAENYIQGTSELLEIIAPAALPAATGPAARVMDAHLAAQVSSIYGGTVEVFRNLIARQLGLPSPMYRN